jgi:co-chaperonin GroES (HSP10)
MKMNVKALYDYVLFKEAENPFLKKKTDSGIFIPEGLAESKETGGIEALDRLIGFAIVEVAGAECKYLKPGDGIFYDRRSIRPVPMTDTLWQFSERNVVAYVEKDDESFIAAVAAYNGEAKSIEDQIKQNASNKRAEEKAKLDERLAKLASGELVEKPLSPLIKIN